MLQVLGFLDVIKSYLCWAPPLRAEHTSTWSPSRMVLVPRSNSLAATAALTSADMAATSLLIA